MLYPKAMTTDEKNNNVQRKRLFDRIAADQRSGGGLKILMRSATATLV